MITVSKHKRPVAIVALTTALLVTGVLYTSGLSGSFLFDDHPSLSGIQHVNDLESALLFVATNETGPLGRPVAMASFLPDRSAYPDDPGVFLLTNVLIHLLNGVLVFIFAALLLGTQAESEKKAWLAAGVAAGLWLVLPLHAATVLLVIQRMASLTVTFMLLSLVGYLFARRHIDRRPGPALAGMVLSMALFGGLALLTKENAAVLPLLLLICEMTILPRPRRLHPRVWRLWIGAVLALPTAILIFYLASLVPYSNATVAIRGFTAGERFLTQTVILWQYLFMAFVPSAVRIHPFYDALPLIRDIFQPTVILAIAAWLLAIGMAVWYRRTLPLLALGVFWYLGAQLVESTVVSLELFFSHRSYLPLVGVTIMIGWGLVNLPRNLRGIGWFGFSAYAILLAAILFNTTSIWGNPRVAAEIWYYEQPDSPRAIGFLLEQYVDENSFGAAARLLESKSAHPRLGHLYQVQKLVVLCLFEQSPEERPDVGDLADQLRRGGFTHGQPSSLRKLFELHSESDCKLLDLADIRFMAQALLDNPAYSRSRPASHALNNLIGRISLELGDDATAAEHFFAATNIRHDPFAINQLFAIHVRHEDAEAIANLVDWMKRNPPANRVVHARWSGIIERMESSVQ